jgi:hypothetical protein
VSINELIAGVSIALNALPVSACRPFDINGNAAVEIDEIIACVNAALRGCSQASARRDDQPPRSARRELNERAGEDR